jgi:TolA-binding protein
VAPEQDAGNTAAPEAPQVPLSPAAAPETGEAGPQIEPEPEAPGPETEPEVEPEIGPEPEAPEIEPEPEAPEIGPEVEPQMEPEIEVQTEPEIEPEIEPEVEPEPEIEPEIESEPEIEPEIEPAPEIEPGPEEPVLEALPEERPEVLPSPDISLDEEEQPLPEPFIDLADASVEPLPPPEEFFPSPLPEPLPPYLPEPPEIPALVEAPAEPPVQPEAVPGAVTVAPIPVVPAPVQEIPPVVSPPAVLPVTPAEPEPEIPAETALETALETARPPFIRPAEEEQPPVAREPVFQPVLPESPAYVPPETGETGMNFSRVVRATVGQLVEVPFRGTGWVYLGELGSRPGIVYNSRRLDPEGQSFVFRVEAEGVYGLKFYKQDFVRDYILNDYVQVVAGAPPEAAATGWFNPAVDRGRVVAEPRWPSALEEAEAIDRASGVETRAARTAEEPLGTEAVGATGVGPLVLGGPTPETGGSAQAAPPGGTPSPAREAAQPETTGPEAAGTETTQSETARPGTTRSVSDEGVVPVQAAAPASREPAESRDQALSGAAETRQGKDLLPGEYLDSARREYDAGRVATALAILDQFRERYPAGSDEAWWLYGQFYEASGPSRDVRAALDYYRRLVREYPQSRRYNDAQRRIAYLERYYINIR